MKQTKKYEVECWLPELKLKKKREDKKDGTIFKLFPSFGPKPRFEVSVSLLSEIEKLAERGEEMILHLHDDRSLLAYLILYHFKKLPIVVQHLGSGLRRPIITFIERQLFKTVDYFFVLSKYKKEYLSKHIGINPNKILVQPMGVDFRLGAPAPRALRALKSHVKAFLWNLKKINETLSTRRSTSCISRSLRRKL